MVGGNPAWFICDTNISPIEKSSGFQKFILGLAIRIALSKFGTTGMLSMQLFIDEGFTTCDSDNISKVPKFLNNMLALFPNGILLVSHMDDIKICAKLNINLNRDLLESTTMCQHGCRLFS
jgi:DNA repair exonuclease SbcCD ATPase subunit